MDENPKQSNGPNEQPLLLSRHEDYLGQWLAILLEHYPGEANEAPSLAISAYRIGLGDLTPRELDLAFKTTLRNHEKGFRPSAGEIRKYLRQARESLVVAQQRPILPEPELDEQARAEILKQIRERSAFVGAVESPKPHIVEITPEMRDRQERLKREAVERFENKRSARPALTTNLELEEIAEKIGESARETIVKL